MLDGKIIEQGNKNALMYSSSAMRRQTSVTAYLKNKQLLLFAFVRRVNVTESDLCLGSYMDKAEYDP